MCKAVVLDVILLKWNSVTKIGLLFLKYVQLNLSQNYNTVPCVSLQYPYSSHSLEIDFDSLGVTDKQFFWYKQEVLVSATRVAVFWNFVAHTPPSKPI